MNVLVLSRFGRLGASSRLRILQYVPYLESRGFKVTVSPLQRDDFVQSSYYGRMSLLTILRSYVERLTVLLGSCHYDLLWIEKELLPWIPAWVEKAVIPSGIPYLVDYDDAVFHNYDLHRSPLVRIVYRRKIDDVMRRAAMVIAGNDYLGQRAQRAGARRVEYLPTVIDINRYRVRAGAANGAFTIGWIGSPYTERYLFYIQTALRKVCSNLNARLILVGAREISLPGVSLEVRCWSEGTEVSAILDFDVGLMPIRDEPFERGKCGYKLIQYMACGKPVVASPIGVNTQIVDHGVNGFLARSESEWINALSILWNDAGLREKMGRAGRKTVETRYCLQVTAPRFETLLREAARG